MPTIRPTRPALAAAAAAILALALPALAQRSLTFEDFPIGTVITNQYPGVVLAAVGNSCGAGSPVSLTIQSPSGGAFSGTRALFISPGCPDFSPDFLRMTFTHPQSSVSFALRGAGGSTFAVRSFDEAGNPLATPPLTFNVTPAGTAGAYRLVTVAAATRVIKRIEVQNLISDFEIIDDLTYAADVTPPEVDIFSPAVGACVSPGGPITIVGRVCDSGGEYVGDTLDYRPVDAPAATPWTPADSASGALCEGGTLYEFTPSPGLTGSLFVRLTGRNLDGLQSSATTIVFIDADPPAAELRFPPAAQIVRGAVCFDGTVNDRCGVQYRVDYRPGAAGAFIPVSAATPQYTGPIINDPLVPAWNTATPATPDGPYQARIFADDGRGNTTTITRSIIIDNTPPTALITSPLACRHLCGTVAITGVAADPHLASWTLQYTGGDAAGWVTIASGTSSIVGGALGLWNTAGLRPCAYTLRLVATDAADPGCTGAAGNRAEFTVSIDLGPLADFNRDLAVNSSDISAFLTAWLRGVNGMCE